jgi:putative sterol carrier protein
MNAGTVKEFFRQLPQELDAEAAEDVNAVYQFDLSGPQGGQYVLTIHEGTCQVREGTHDDPDVTLSMAGEDCVRVLSGQLSGQAAALSGKLKVSGDLGLALQLRSLFPGLG